MDINIHDFKSHDGSMYVCNIWQHLPSTKTPVMLSHQSTTYIYIWIRHGNGGVMEEKSIEVMSSNMACKIPHFDGFTQSLSLHFEDESRETTWCFSRQKNEDFLPRPIWGSQHHVMNLAGDGLNSQNPIQSFAIRICPK